MRVSIGVVLVLASVLGGCRGDDDGEDAPGDAACLVIDVGECTPPEGRPVPVATVAAIPAGCIGPASLTVVRSSAEWDARQTCGLAVPDGVDFATDLVAIVQVDCLPIETRFAVETTADVVLGVGVGRAGGVDACGGSSVVVRLPATTRPVRLARCTATATGDCQPAA